MDTPKQCGRENPYRKANIFSRILFCFVESLFGISKTEKINHENMYQITSSEETSRCGEKLERAWQKEIVRHKAGKSVSFQRALVRAYGLYYIAAGSLVLVEDICRFAQPILFQYLIGYFTEEPTMSRNTALMYAGGIALASLIQAVVGPQVVVWFIRAGMQWQGGAVSLVYKKIFRLSQTQLSEVTSGHIVDLVSSDAEKLDYVIWFLHVIWQAPVHTAITMYLIYQQLGWTAFAGLGVAVLLVPLQAILAWIISLYTEKTYAKMDERVGMMGEIIGGMRVIKMYCWEKPFGELIDSIRRVELKNLWKSRAISSFLIETDTFNSRLIIVVIVTVYVATAADNITAAKVFPAFALINLLSQTLLNALPWGIKTYLEASVSSTRLRDFLLTPEINDDVAPGSYTGRTLTNKQEASITLTDYVGIWKKGEPQSDEVEKGSDEKTPLLSKSSSCDSLEKSKPVLEDISFTISGHKLMAVVGPVGSSKSSLLMALLGELKAASGSVEVTGNLSYSAQSPWVFAATIRQNILFGREYDPDWYAQVIEATALVKDLSQLPHGDLSLVGEKGVTLSGGQKARVSLARAVYASQDIILMDDPLSAVDADVGRHIFDKCINGLLKDKLRVLVTHQGQYLRNVQDILVFKKGKMTGYGSYSSLTESGIDLDHVGTTNDETASEDVVDVIDDDSKDISALKKQLSLEEQEEQEDEDRAIGKISWRAYRDFFQAGAPGAVLFLVFVLCLLSQGAYNVSDWWLSIWSVAEEYVAYNESFSNTTVAPPLGYDLGSYTNAVIYTSLTIATFLLGLSRTLAFFRITTNSSRNLHNQMYQSVIRSPVRFYDANPKGRILNRFSGDCGSLDSAVPDNIQEFLQSGLLLLGNLLLIIILNPWTLVPTVPLVIALLIIRLRYIRLQREVQRCTSEAHSPVLTHLNATLEGVQTIRAFRREKICTDDFHEHYNVFYGGWFTEMNIFGWFQFRNNLMAAIFNIASVFILTLLAEGSNAGQAGLTLSYLMPMMWYVETTTRLSADMEIEMVRSERVLRYTKLEPEAELTSRNPPPTSWPPEGSIEFINVNFRYHDKAPKVLKELNLKIDRGAKIGVVGRTGAGKSSIIQALFRMAEPEGEIKIDGLNIQDMGLHELRSKLSIIPQDPVLFKGSIRFNLDPFNDHSDNEMWTVLEEVQLKTLVSEKDGGLEAEVTEGGGNFSVGEKQLFCLGRAILRNNKILLIDEATANVDKRTDGLIQKSIHDKFNTCTVITIAHRINTVLDSDKILVMNEGEAIEFDSPDVLLNDKNSYFYQIAGKSGYLTAQNIKS